MRRQKHFVLFHSPALPNLIFGRFPTGPGSRGSTGQGESAGDTKEPGDVNVFRGGRAGAHEPPSSSGGGAISGRAETRVLEDGCVQCTCRGVWKRRGGVRLFCKKLRVRRGSVCWSGLTLAEERERERERESKRNGEGADRPETQTNSSSLLDMFHAPRLLVYGRLPPGGACAGVESRSSVRQAAGERGTICERQ